MVAKSRQPDTDSRTGSHSEHLCYMISQGFHLTDAAEYNALLENPRYICHHCERIAASGRNLCVPIDL